MTLTRESRAGEFPGFLVGGPFGYDVAKSPEAARMKALLLAIAALSGSAEG